MFYDKKLKKWMVTSVRLHVKIAIKWKCLPMVKEFVHKMTDTVYIEMCDK